MADTIIHRNIVTMALAVLTYISADPNFLFVLYISDKYNTNEHDRTVNLQICGQY